MVIKVSKKEKELFVFNFRRNTEISCFVTSFILVAPTFIAMIFHFRQLWVLGLFLIGNSFLFFLVKRDQYTDLENLKNHNTVHDWFFFTFWIGVFATVTSFLYILYPESRAWQ